MSKNIVICCDGTSNEFGDENTNVLKLYQVLVRDSAKQVVYYQPGVGTAGEVDWTWVIGRLIGKIKWILGMAVGYGLLSNLANCYRFLMDHYEPGDRIYIFGFSRGAYTARALAAFIHLFGVFENGNYVSVDYAVKLFKKEKKVDGDYALMGNFKNTFGRHTKIQYVGVWDTVSSVGLLFNPFKLPRTYRNPDISSGRHALAIDEKRSSFRQNSWLKTSPDQKLEEEWFAGVHSDVGGGYPERESALSKIPFKWIVDGAVEAGLIVEAGEYDAILGADTQYTKPDPAGLAHESLTIGWWILEFIPRKVYHFKKHRDVWVIPLFRSRFINEAAQIHESVSKRKNAIDYKPRNVPRIWG